MDNPPRPFTAERRMAALSGSEDTVTNKDLLDALGRLFADAGGKTEQPPSFTAERRSGKLSASADAISNRDLLDAFNNLSDLLRDIVAEQQPPDPPADSGGEASPEEAVDAAVWEQALRDIADLKSSNAEEDRMVLARREIETVVAATDAAANEIMNLSDAIQEVSGKLRGEPVSAETVAAATAAAQAYSDTLDEIATNLMIACSFQDLTGQRLNKVTNTLQSLEDQVDGLFRTLDISDGTGEGGLLSYTAEDKRPDKELLHGPQDEGEGISQAEIDAMFD